jgi:hypothetical protein
MIQRGVSATTLRGALMGRGVINMGVTGKAGLGQRFGRIA